MTDEIAVVSAPAMSRPGLDTAVVDAIKAVDLLLKEMREGLVYPTEATDEDSAVKFYLLYATMLVDSVLPDILLSAIAGHDVMVLMKLRLILEYAGKAMNAHDHPDYAMFIMTVGEAQRTLKKAVRAGAPGEILEAIRLRLEELKTRFPSVAGMKELHFDEIFERYGFKQDYAGMYKSPSALLHGDPEGFREFIARQPDGSDALTLTYPVEKVNAMLADAGLYALYVCEHFIRKFRPDDETFVKRADRLHRTFATLLLRHTYGRSPQSLEALRESLG